MQGKPITFLSVAAEKCLSGANGVSIRRNAKVSQRRLGGKPSMSTNLAL